MKNSIKPYKFMSSGKKWLVIGIVIALIVSGVVVGVVVGGKKKGSSPDPATGSCRLDKSIKCEDICPGDVCKGKFMSDETCLDFALIDGPEKALLESGCDRANEQILKTSIAPWEEGKPNSPCNKGFCKFVPGDSK